MLMKTDALCWFRKEGEPARECWIAGSDSDSEDSDYDNTHHRGGEKRGSYIRVVNSDAYIESDCEDDGFESDSPDCNIYPAPDHQHSRYRHAHLRYFSQTAIKKYNHDTGNRFEFLELVEASVRTMVEYALIVVIFKASQSDDTTMATTTSFRAETRSASKSLSDSYDIDAVVPLHSHSHISSAPGSESDS